MELIKNFILNLQFIFRPSYWEMLRKYCLIHDTILNKLIKDHRFTNYNRYRVYLGEYPIWIANHPYATRIYTEEFTISRPS